MIHIVGRALGFGSLRIEALAMTYAQHSSIARRERGLADQAKRALKRLGCDEFGRPERAIAKKGSKL